MTKFIITDKRTGLLEAYSDEASEFNPARFDGQFVEMPDEIFSKLSSGCIIYFRNGEFIIQNPK